MLKKNIYLMYAISCLQGMVFYGPIATLYRQAQGVTVFEITLIESISLVLCLLLELPWGIISSSSGPHSACSPHCRHGCRMTRSTRPTGHPP